MYEVMQLLQTLRSLITQINSICARSAIRFIFGLLFYFTPQFNPYRWVDAYEAVQQASEAQKQAGMGANRKTMGSATARSRPPVDGVDDTAEDLSAPGGVSLDASSDKDEPATSSTSPPSIASET